MVMAVALAFVLVGCFGGGEAEEQEFQHLAGFLDDSLVGTWQYQGNVTQVHLFSEEGTGSRPGIDGNRQFFEWSTPYEGVLTLVFGTVSETWEYQIFGDELVLNDQQAPNTLLTFDRIVPEVPEVGEDEENAEDLIYTVEIEDE